MTVLMTSPTDHNYDINRLSADKVNAQCSIIGPI